MQKHVFLVAFDKAGSRLDAAASSFSSQERLGLSRTFIKELICSGDVYVNGSAITKAHHKVKEGDKVEFVFREKEKKELIAQDIKLKIVYDDEDLSVIDKPSGLVVHPAPGNPDGTLVNALRNIYPSLSDINPARPGIVHRLDKGTSGLLVIAKNNETHLNLAKQFSQHVIKKEYLAIVKGRVEFDEDVIEAPISRHAFKRKNMSVGFTDKAKYAKTYYRTLKRSKDFSVLEIRPFTGRTHQIRVHLDFIGHPILGDDKYGKNNVFSRLALHAKTLGFTHPKTGSFMEFSSPIPSEFKDFLK